MKKRNNYTSRNGNDKDVCTKLANLISPIDLFKAVNLNMAMLFLSVSFFTFSSKS